MAKHNHKNAMEPDKNTPAENEQPKEAEEQQAPADALSRTPEDLEQEQAEKQAEADTHAPEVPEKKVSPIKKFFRKVNVYFLLFGLLVAVGGIFTVVNYLNSQKAAPKESIASQKLTEEALKQLANTDASVGNTSQTLTIQGNAVIAGQTLMRGDLNVAGNFQTGGSIQGPSLTISGQSNLGEAQINNLQVASDTAIQGNTSLEGTLSVAGAASFSGAITASQITASRLTLSGDGILEIPNHLSFSGPAPSHSIQSGALGSGGSASINGSDTTGTVNINTGGNTLAGCFIRVNFNRAFARQPHVIISPVGPAAGRTQYYVDRSTSGFSICAASAAPAHQTFAFDYFVTG